MLYEVVCVWFKQLLNCELLQFWAGGHDFILTRGCKSMQHAACVVTEVRVVPQETTTAVLTTCVATTVGGRELWPGDVDNSFRDICASFQKEEKERDAARTAALQDVSESYMEDLLVSRLASRVVRAMNTVGVGVATSSDVGGSDAPDFDIMTTVTGHASRRRSQRPVQLGQPHAGAGRFEGRATADPEALEVEEAAAVDAGDGDDDDELYQADGAGGGAYMARLMAIRGVSKGGTKAGAKKQPKAKPKASAPPPPGQDAMPPPPAPRTQLGEIDPQAREILNMGTKADPHRWLTTYRQELTKHPEPTHNLFFASYVQVCVKLAFKDDDPDMLIRLVDLQPPGPEHSPPDRMRQALAQTLQSAYDAGMSLQEARTLQQDSVLQGVLGTMLKLKTDESNRELVVPATFSKICAWAAEAGPCQCPVVLEALGHIRVILDNRATVAMVPDNTLLVDAMRWFLTPLPTHDRSRPAEVRSWFYNFLQLPKTKSRPIAQLILRFEASFLQIETSNKSVLDLVVEVASLPAATKDQLLPLPKVLWLVERLHSLQARGVELQALEPASAKLRECRQAVFEQFQSLLTDALDTEAAASFLAAWGPALDKPVHTMCQHCVQLCRALQACRVARSFGAQCPEDTFLCVESTGKTLATLEGLLREPQPLVARDHEVCALWASQVPEAEDALRELRRWFVALRECCLKAPGAQGKHGEHQVRLEAVRAAGLCAIPDFGLTLDTIQECKKEAAFVGSHWSAIMDEGLSPAIDEALAVAERLLDAPLKYHPEVQSTAPQRLLAIATAHVQKSWRQWHEQVRSQGQGNRRVPSEDVDYARRLDGLVSRAGEAGAEARRCLQHIVEQHEQTMAGAIVSMEQVLVPWWEKLPGWGANDAVSDVQARGLVGSQLMEHMRKEWGHARAAEVDRMATFMDIMLNLQADVNFASVWPGCRPERAGASLQHIVQLHEVHSRQMLALEAAAGITEPETTTSLDKVLAASLIVNDEFWKLCVDASVSRAEGKVVKRALAEVEAVAPSPPAPTQAQPQPKKSRKK